MRDHLARDDAGPEAPAPRELLIDTAAIAENVRLLRRHVAPAALLVVVKADGYGHGAELAARAALAGGADWLGTADVTEALALRAAGIDAPLLTWLHTSGTDFAAAITAGVDLGVSSAAELERVAAAGPAAVHLKLDTGLGRNGIPSADAAAVFGRAAELEAEGSLRVRGIFSHLSNTSDEEDARQLSLFHALVERAREAGLRPELRHLAASAGALRHPEAHLDLVRTGIAAYGLAPEDDVDVTVLGLRPAMEAAAEVIAVKRVPAGHGVSYGFAYRTPRETTLALIPLGYADGIPRAASGRGPVVIRGERFTVAGRIAMDQFVVDVGDAPVRIGDRAVLWGDPATGAPAVEEWADAAGTISYEIVTRVGGRFARSAARKAEPDEGRA